jgi:hypothetical protein
VSESPELSQLAGAKNDERPNHDALDDIFASLQQNKRGKR